MIPSTTSKHVAIIGCGTIGRRVALLYALHNRKVSLFDQSEDVASHALYWIQSQLYPVTAERDQLNVVHDLQDAATDAWMVVECIPEVVHQKAQLLENLSHICAPDTIIATNSSSIRSSILVSNIAPASQSRILNTHYLSPPEAPFVELMSCGKTSPHVIDFLGQELRKVGRHPIICKADSTGFIVNRIWAAIKREIMMVLADGAGSPTEIDTMFKYSLQSKLGPCELMEQIGLQTVCDIEEHYMQERKYLPSYPVDFFRKNYVERGDMGLVPRQNHSTVEATSQPRERLTGAWELVECTSISDFESLSSPLQKNYPFGRDVSGHLLYGETGYVSAQLHLPGQDLFKSSDYWNGSVEELSQAGRRYYAYTGPFYIDESGKEAVVHHGFTHCIFPNVVGKIERRLVRFEVVDGVEVLILTPENPAVTSEGRRVKTQLTWKRLPVNTTSTQK
jgi:3-hydroxyacyl-CoA dehydrogenase